METATTAGVFGEEPLMGRRIAELLIGECQTTMNTLRRLRSNLYMKIERELQEPEAIEELLAGNWSHFIADIRARIIRNKPIRLHYEDHIDNNFQWTLEYLILKCGMWSPEKTGYFETQTKGFQEATVLLYLAYNNSTTNDLEGLKCNQKIRTIGTKQVPQVNRYLYTAIYININD